MQTMRWRQSYVPSHLRRCRYCFSDEPPDEQHYTLKCPLFDLQRRQRIPRYYYNRPNTMKMRELFSSKSTRVLTNLAYFVKHIMAYFNQSAESVERLSACLQQPAKGMTNSGCCRQLTSRQVEFLTKCQKSNPCCY